MVFTMRVKLVLEDASETGLPGVRVALYDRDECDQDDFLSESISDEHGEAFFAFQSYQYADLEDQPEWAVKSLPDLYVVIYDDQDRQVLSTREQVQIDRLPLLITVRVPLDLARQHGFVLSNSDFQRSQNL